MFKKFSSQRWILAWQSIASGIVSPSHKSPTLRRFQLLLGSPRSQRRRARTIQRCMSHRQTDKTCTCTRANIYLARKIHSISVCVVLLQLFQRKKGKAAVMKALQETQTPSAADDCGIVKHASEEAFAVLKRERKQAVLLLSTNKAGGTSSADRSEY